MSAVAHERRGDLLPVAAQALWHDLPVVLLGSVLVCAGVLTALLAGAGVTPVSLLLLAVTAGPAWAALVATTDELVLGGDAGCADLLRNLRRHGTAGVRVALVPCTVTSLTVLSSSLYAGSGELWLLAPLAVGCVSSVVVVLAAVAAVPLRVQHGVRGRPLWVAAVGVVAGRPLIALGVVALVALGVLASTSLSASLLVLVPGPAALAVSAGVWTAAGQLGIRVPLREPPTEDGPTPHRRPSAA